MTVTETDEAELLCASSASPQRVTLSSLNCAVSLPTSPAGFFGKEPQNDGLKIGALHPRPMDSLQACGGVARAISAKERETFLSSGKRRARSDVSSGSTVAPASTGTKPTF